MELEVGMYVRTKDGYIDKIVLIEYAEERKNKYPNHPSKNHWRDKILLFRAGYWRTTQNIIKASYNIIDLIEVGDYVNGKQVIDKWEEPFGAFAGEIFIKLAGEDTVPTMRKIENIVTKEQFEAMKYEIK